MASSNRHWPSMFKSKPCNNHQHHHQWQQHQHDLLSSTCHRSPYSSAVVGCEERSPEPKPRWNPRPEQIRILEAIFNSGMVNPPRDEIRKIRGQLQEYGQVGDANVFYWFQNRKSRSKHKQRSQITSSKSHAPPPPPSNATTSPVIPAATSSPISTPENVAAGTRAVVSSPDGQAIGVGPSGFYEPLTPFEQFLFPVQQVPNVTCTSGTGTSLGQSGFGFSSHAGNLVHVREDPMAVILEQQMILGGGGKKRVNVINEGEEDDDDEKMKLQQLMSYNNSFSATHLVASTTSSSVVTAAATVTTQSPFNHILGIEHQSGPAPGRYTVFINDVAFEVAMAPLNVREAFGDDAVLFHSSGQPVLTDEWGVTLQPLQHGCLYYLLRALLS